MEELQWVEEILRQGECDEETRTVAEVEFSENPTESKSKLSLAMALSKSRDLQDKQRSTQLFEELIVSNQFVDICYYNLSLLYYSIGNYTKALMYVQEFMILNPEQQQGRKLHKALTHRQAQEKGEETQQNMVVAGLVGVAAVGLFALSKALSGKKRWVAATFVPKLVMDIMRMHMSSTFASSMPVNNGYAIETK